nr:helix-turn-helix transcriptional regulator [Hymenobacter psoromatis]
MRTPGDFARCLSVHVNHLNRALRELTGKTTSVHIAERITREAKALLQHTNWSTAKIAYGLGFEYPTYFNNFFKKQTGTTPSALRALLSQDHEATAPPPAV